MEVGFRTIYLKKKFPLRISRGLKEGGENLFVSISQNGYTGWGEMAPGKTEGADSAEAGQASIQSFCDSIDLDQLSIHEIYDLAIQHGLPSCALAALDIALWDLKAKEAGLPLRKMLGCPLTKVPTSVTIGINPPEVVKERVPILLEGTGVKALKIKLGSNHGIDADKAMFMQVLESNKPYGAAMRVDANGGWSVHQAIYMMAWLADRGVEYVEQPLEEGREKDLIHLFKNRPLPIFVDESCRYSHQIPAYANVVDGVNLKLMKCGGITEALRIIATARAFKLKTMIGCMGESSISISAGASIAGLIDYIDLDSHLNLDPDPASGAKLQDGVIVPNDEVGHGGTLQKNANSNS